MSKPTDYPDIPISQRFSERAYGAEPPRAAPAPSILTWTPHGDPPRYELVLHQHRLTVEQMADDSWRATDAQDNAPPGHILAFTTHATRRAAMTWAAQRVEPAIEPRTIMHLIGDKA